MPLVLEVVVLHVGHCCKLEGVPETTYQIPNLSPKRGNGELCKLRCPGAIAYPHESDHIVCTSSFKFNLPKEAIFFTYCFINTPIDTKFF